MDEYLDYSSLPTIGIERYRDFVPRIFRCGSPRPRRGAVVEQSPSNPKIRDMPLNAFYDDRFVR